MVAGYHWSTCAMESTSGQSSVAIAVIAAVGRLAATVIAVMAVNLRRRSERNDSRDVCKEYGEKSCRRRIGVRVVEIVAEQKAVTCQGILTCMTLW